MKRLAIAFSVALAVHGIGYAGLAFTYPDHSAKLNLNSGQTSMRMAFQSATAAPSRTEKQDAMQSHQAASDSTRKNKKTNQNEDTKSSLKSERSPESADEPKPDSSSRVSKKQQQSETVSRKSDKSTDTNPKSLAQQASSSSEQNHETSNSTKNPNKSRKVNKSSSSDNSDEKESRAPASVKSKGAKWVNTVDYRENPAPRYPTKARVMGTEGRVRLLVTIDRKGKPISVEVHESSGSFKLDEAALEAVRDWTFVPAKNGGNPVRSKTIVPVTFSLEEK